MAVDLFAQMDASLSKSPVDIVTFAESPKYCNRTLYPRQKLLLKLMFLEDLTEQEEEVLDYWIAGGHNGNEIVLPHDIRDRIQWCKDNGYKHFRQVVLVGGRRCSKGFITSIALTKLMFDAMQLGDPHQHYGIDRDKEILFSVVAASQEQAKDMQYADFAGMVNSCNSMQKNISKMQELEFSVATEKDLRNIRQWKKEGRRVGRDVSSLRGKALPANARTIRGSATMAYAFDEFAHFLQGESAQTDDEVYSAATPSLAQFGREAMIFANSSPYSKVGKFYDLFKEGRAVDENGKPESPTTLSLQFPSWALFEGWWDDPNWTGPKKCVTVSPDWDPDRIKVDEDGNPILDENGIPERFYTEDDIQAIYIARVEEANDPDKFAVERRGRFAEVIDAYLKPEMVDRMFKGIPSGDFEEAEYKPLKSNPSGSSYQYNYYAHIDPSSTTAGFGFAMGHIEQIEFNGKIEAHMVFDVIKRWDPHDFEDNVIEWEPILEELVYYCNIFRPVQMTFDQHNSQYPIQYLKTKLRKMNIATRVFEKTSTSADNWHRAETFRTLLYQNKVHAPYDTPDIELAALELKYLQEVRTASLPRVEKQDTGPVTTKDIADAIMEVVESALGNQMASITRDSLSDMEIQTGAQGGYQIGGGNGGGMGSETRAALSNLYGPRQGEQSFGGGKRDTLRGNPARRAFGGRPIPRRLPGR
jgi:hypothetical protein